MKMLTENDLNELERRAKLATPRPWDQGDYISHAIFSPKGMVLFDDYNKRMNFHNDIAYIVAACNAVPDLVTEIRTLQKKVQELELKNMRLDAGNRHLIEELDALEHELNDVKESWKL